jgi:hypothetical protein
MDESRQCTARSKRSGERCKRAAILGGRVCPMHGGKVPAVRAAAQQRLARRDAETFVHQAVATQGSLGLAEVYDELLRTAAIVVQWRNLLEVKLASLEQWRYTAYGPGTEQLRSEVGLFERALDRSAKVLDLIVRLNIDARKAALSERQGTQVATAIRRLLDDLHLTPEQSARAPEAVARALRSLADS